MLYFIDSFGYLYRRPPAHDTCGWQFQRFDGISTDAPREEIWTWYSHEPGDDWEPCSSAKALAVVRRYLQDAIDPPRRPR